MTRVRVPCGVRVGLLTRDGAWRTAAAQNRTQHTGPMHALSGVAIEEASPRRGGRCASVCRRIARTC